MNPLSRNAPTAVFDLPDPHSPKNDPRLLADDEGHFARLAEALRQTVERLERRRDEVHRQPAREGQELLERDLELQRVSARLRLLGRFGPDLTLGRMVPEHGAPVYVGRVGLLDAEGEPLLVDWRTPAAEPFFAATHAHPMGLASRRRYRWTAGRVTDYWDEALTAAGAASSAALDDPSAFVAGLGASRSSRMRDVLATLAADQDAVVRAGSRGALVVDGGPGTGKTVVALHRAAYLLHADPRLQEGRGGVLVVGPHDPYLAYVEDVLPSLGEDGVATATLRDLVPLPGHPPLPDESDPEVARLKADGSLVDAVEEAVRFYEEPPTDLLEVSTDAGDVVVTPDDWARAFTAPGAGAPHNEVREQVRAELVDLLLERLADDDEQVGDEGEEGSGTERGQDAVRRQLLADEGLRETLERAWPLVEPEDLVADLWTVPAYLRLAAPGLAREDVRRLQRADGQAWTTADLPVLDAARRRLGDPTAARDARRRDAVLAGRRAEMARVVDHLVETDTSEMRLMSMLRGADLSAALDDGDALPRRAADRLAGPFAHVVVDEAQELTDAQWRMVLARCPSRSVTVVGDRAQARAGFPETWAERPQRNGFGDVTVATLSLNYRTPQEVMDHAAPYVLAELPDANVPTSVRRSGIPVRTGARADLVDVVTRWEAEHAEGVGCVVGAADFPGTDRTRSLTPQLVKGLEFDLVVVVEPDAFGDGVAGAVDRYVAMTRATRELVVLT